MAPSSTLSLPPPPVADVEDSRAAANHSDARQRINLAWLIRLRWAAVIGQSVTVAAVSGLLHVALPLPPLLAVLMLTAAGNLLLMQRAKSRRPVSEELIGMVVTLDIVMLTALLYFTGGSTNPFNFLYLVHIALAAVTLQVNWICALVALAFACFIALFWWHVPLMVGRMPVVPLRLHAQGMTVAFILATGFIVYFVNRVTGALSARDQELGRAREASARSERLSSLATLAAGAAHELSTPLATIAIIAKELERHLARLADAGGAPLLAGSPAAAPSSAAAPAGAGAICCVAESSGASMASKVTDTLTALRGDARLIRQQVERCRAVLVHMAADAGASAGEPMADISVADLVQMAFAELPQRQRVVLHAEPAVAQTRLHLSPRSVAQALRSVLKNALEASQSPPLPVHLRLHLQPAQLQLEVTDQGFGMSSETLTHISEPFYTTKAPGLGMGLGLFLTRTVLEGMGGHLRIQSVANRGTTAILTIPLPPAGPLQGATDDVNL